MDRGCVVAFVRVCRVSVSGTIASVAERLGVGYDTIRKWVERAKFNADRSLIPTDLPPEQRIRELEKENARLRMERDILKKATAYFAALEGGTPR